MKPFITEFVVPLLVDFGAEAILQTTLVYLNWLYAQPYRRSYVLYFPYNEPKDFFIKRLYEATL